MCFQLPQFWNSTLCDVFSVFLSVRFLKLPNCHFWCPWLIKFWWLSCHWPAWIQVDGTQSKILLGPKTTSKTTRRVKMSCVMIEGGHSKNWWKIHQTTRSLFKIFGDIFSHLKFIPILHKMLKLKFYIPLWKMIDLIKSANGVIFIINFIPLLLQSLSPDLRFM